MDDGTKPMNEPSRGFGSLGVLFGIMIIFWLLVFLIPADRYFRRYLDERVREAAAADRQPILLPTITVRQ